MYISRVCTWQEEFLGLIWQEFFYMQLCFTRQRKTERYEQPSKVHFFGWPAGGLSASAGLALISTDISAQMNTRKWVICLIFLLDTAQLT